MHKQRRAVQTDPVALVLAIIRASLIHMLSTVVYNFIITDMLKNSVYDRSMTAARTVSNISTKPFCLAAGGLVYALEPVCI